ncbi:MAG: hypothetical protein HQL81_12130 [Magnetococcales bacterium]|nr:hypothetical protein [Magnetococcales bacterium]
MFYFYFLECGEIHALYNGRLAFFLRIKESEAREYISGVHRLEYIFEIMQHEFSHYNIFPLSITGFFLSGHRYYTRLRYRGGRCPEVVEKHYQARTIFYNFMQVIHEHLVEEIEESGHKSVDWTLRLENSDFVIPEKGKALVQLIKETDNKVISCWLDSKIFNRCQFVIQKSLFSLLGRIMHRNFTIVVGGFKEHDWKESWISMGGFVNDIEECRPNESLRIKFLKKIAHYVKLESSEDKVKSDCLWMLIKFKAEFETAKKYCGFSEEKFEYYVLKIVMFASGWAEFDNLSATLSLIDIIMRHCNNQLVSLADLEKFYSLEQFGKFVNFFYLHGN